MDESDDLPELSPGPIWDWFAETFPLGPTPVQRLAWPAIASGDHVLLSSATGTGKTLAAFLGLLDRLHREYAKGQLKSGLRCVYVSPLRSLGADIAKNLSTPLEALRQRLGLESSPIRVAVRNSDTPDSERRRLRDDPPHLLITTPESLSLLLAQPAWSAAWESVEQIIIDEVHALVSNKRGADLAVSLERLTAKARRDPMRIGLSATCRPLETVARFLVGPDRPCRWIEAPRPSGDGPLILEVESLLERDEGTHRDLTYRRLIRRIREELDHHRTTIIFANTRAFTEKITHDLRRSVVSGAESIAAHHSAIDAGRRREVESSLKAGTLRAVVTSTSLELGVDIGSIDLALLIGLPGGVDRCLQRVGRSGHQRGAVRRGLILAATPAELAGAAITAKAAREGRIEPLDFIKNPLDVLCQQLVGLACDGEVRADEAFTLVRKAAPFEHLSREDFEACLAFLAGELASPAGAEAPEPGAEPRLTSARIWKSRGSFGIRSRRVQRWLWRNVGTIHSEPAVRVLVEGREVGTLEANYAERLVPGDRFLLDGRALEFQSCDGLALVASASDGDPGLPHWSSDRPSLSADLARDLAAFREEAADRLAIDGPEALRGWLVEVFGLEPEDTGPLEALFEAQEQISVTPPASGLLVEEWPNEEGLAYTFHSPLPRSACEALGRAVAARLGRRFGQDLSLSVADLGWSIRLPFGAELSESDLPDLLDPANLEVDILEGLDRGSLLANRFRRVAATGLMVLRNPEGGRTRVGGLLWVSRRLFPLVQASCPDHPLLREARREVLDDLLDTAGALDWLRSRPNCRFQRLDGPSPFALAWIEPNTAEPFRFDSPAEALKRLHARLVGAPR